MTFEELAQKEPALLGLRRFAASVNGDIDYMWSYVIKPNIVSLVGNQRHNPVGHKDLFTWQAYEVAAKALRDALEKG